jgi:hypothetical protein
MVEKNLNGIPDYVENVAAQHLASQHLLNAIGFREPREGINCNKVDFFDIHIVQVNGISR